MTFTKPTPFLDALAAQAVKTVLPTSGSSADLASLAPAHNLTGCRLA